VVRRPEEFKKKQGIDVFLRHRVNRLDPKARQIEVEDLERGEKRVLGFDKLVLASGARSRRLGLPGEEAENLFTLKDLQDAIRMKRYVEDQQPRRAGILGSGYIALEMAEAFRTRGLETTIFYRGIRPVSQLEPEIGEHVLRELQDNGVVFLPEHIPIALHTDGGSRIVSIETSKGKYPVDLVLSALGVVPNVEIAQEAGIRLGKTGAVWTDEGQRTDHPDIYAAGDCCEVQHQVLGDAAYMPLGDVANKQGRVAGENAAGGQATFDGVVGSMCFQVFSLEVAVTGVTEKTGLDKGMDVGVQTIEASSKVHYMPGAEPLLLKLVFERPSGRILGGHMVGKEGVARRINTLAVAVQSRMTVEALSRMDFAYAPQFSAPFDPILIAAEQALKKL
jgi:NADPH-dependent 2,4-dienoyl-CoA reductase/sulfur reductase-like enzyme